MWSLFNRGRDLDAEVYGKLRPGDLYGAEGGESRPPEIFVRYLLLANASLLTFAAVILIRVPEEALARREFVAAIWLAALGMAIAAGAWIMFRLSRRGEARALSLGGAMPSAAELPPFVQAVMKKAAITKMLALRLLLVSAIAVLIGLYAGVKGLVLL
jgi:hypothetical protein